MSVLNVFLHTVTDYSPFIDEMVTFGASETVKFIMIPIEVDSVFEGDEVFTAILSVIPDSTGVEIGQQDTATIIIMEGMCYQYIVIITNNL